MLVCDGRTHQRRGGQGGWAEEVAFDAAARRPLPYPKSSICPVVWGGGETRTRSDNAETDGARVLTRPISLPQALPPPLLIFRPGLLFTDTIS